MLFLLFCADLSKKFKSIKAICIYASDRSWYALSESGIVYYAMTYCFGENWVWIWRILLNFCWVSIFFEILIANISWTVAQTPCKLNHFLKEWIISWKNVMTTFRYMLAQNCENDTFLDNLRIMTQEGS